MSDTVPCAGQQLERETSLSVPVSGGVLILCLSSSWLISVALID